MTSEARLGDLAFSRAGDKGDTSILFVAPYLAEDFDRVGALLTEERLRDRFSVDAGQKVTITPIPGLAAFSIAIHGRLDGGVTRSRTSDPHGKTLSSHLLGMAIDEQRSSRS